MDKTTLAMIVGTRDFFPAQPVLETEARPGSVAGKVFVTEPLGDRTIVDVQVGMDLSCLSRCPGWSCRGNVCFEIGEGRGEQTSDGI